MQKWVIVFAIAAILNACSDKPGKRGFEVTGVVSNSSAKLIYLVAPYDSISDGMIVRTGKTTVAQSAIGEDGRYSLKHDATASAVYEISMRPVGQYRQEDPADPSLIAYVINDAPKIKLNADIGKMNKPFSERYEVEGSPASQQLKDFIGSIDNDRAKIYLISYRVDSLQKINAPDNEINLLLAERNSVASNIRNTLTSSMDKATDPALAIYELQIGAPVLSEFGLEAYDVGDVSRIISDLAARFPKHERLVAMKKTISEAIRLTEERRQQQMASGHVGKKAVDFSLPDANGKLVKLSSFKGKYVLVDFWASWCRPCREENPNVVRAYQKFKDKNFTILGVSLDHPGQKDKWLNAVKADNLTWTQLSDLKGWESVVVPMYGFGEVGIPYNFLMDPEGVIIAERLTGKGLEAKLEEVLK